MPRSRSRSPALRSAAPNSPSKNRGNRRRTTSKSPDSSGAGKRNIGFSRVNRNRFSPYARRPRSNSRDSKYYRRKYSRSPIRHGRKSRSPARRESLVGRLSPSRERGQSTRESMSAVSKRKNSSASPSPLHDRISYNDFGENLPQRAQKQELSQRPSKLSRGAERSRSPPSKQVPRTEDSYDINDVDRKELAKIKIIAPNLPNVKDESNASGRRRLEQGIFTLEEVLQQTEDGKIGAQGGTRFNSQEYETPSTKELRKIQIEIRRTIPHDRISTSPVRRSLRDPATVVFSRRVDEGTKQIFDRDEIKHWFPDVPEQRVIAMVGDSSVQRSVKPVTASSPRRRVNRSLSRERKGDVKRSRSRSPAIRHADGGGIRERLGPSSSSTQNETRIAFGGGRKAEWQKLEVERQRRRSAREIDDKKISLSRAFMDEPKKDHLDKSDVKSRLGRREVRHEDDYRLKSTKNVVDSVLYDEDKVLDRNELERLRHANVNAIRPWDTNPEFVPRGNYFEHDNREADLNNTAVRYRGRGRGGRGYDRGGRGYRGRLRSNMSKPGYQRGSGPGYRGNFSRSYGAERGYHDNREGKYSDDGGDSTSGGVNSGYYKRFYGSRGSGSPNWKHDKYEEVQMEEPSSTTNN